MHGSGTLPDVPLAQDETWVREIQGETTSNKNAYQELLKGEFQNHTSVLHAKRGDKLQSKVQQYPSLLVRSNSLVVSGSLCELCPPRLLRHTD